MKKQITLHKMAKILLLLNFTFLTLMCFGQNYKAQFDNLCQSGDTLNQKILLTKWESEDPTNPELFTSYLNYCIQKSELVDLVMQPVQKNTPSSTLCAFFHNHCLWAKKPKRQNTKALAFQ